MCRSCYGKKKKGTKMEKPVKFVYCFVCQKRCKTNNLYHVNGILTGLCHLCTFDLESFRL